MATLPGLPALDFKAPQVPDILGEYGKVAALKGALQAQAAQQQQMQYEQQMQPLRMQGLQQEQDIRNQQLQMAQLQYKEEKQRLDDMGIWGKLYMDNKGSSSGTLDAVMNSPDISPQGKFQIMGDMYKMTDYKVSQAAHVADAQTKANELFKQPLRNIAFAQTPEEAETYKQQLLQLMQNRPELAPYAPHVPTDPTQMTQDWAKQAYYGTRTHEDIASDDVVAPYDQAHLKQINKMIDDRQTLLGIKPNPDYHLMSGDNYKNFQIVDKLMEAAEKAKQTQTQQEFNRTLAGLNYRYKTDPFSYLYGDGPQTPGLPGVTTPQAPPTQFPTAPQPQAAQPTVPMPPQARVQPQPQPPAAAQPTAPTQPPAVQPTANVPQGTTPAPGGGQYDPRFPARVQGTYIPGVPDELVARTPSLQWIATQIPRQLQSTIYGMVAGTSKLPPLATRNIASIKLRNAAQQADPGLGEERFDLYQRYTRDAADGEIGAINTALGHLGDLGNAIFDLNTNNVKALNAIAIKWGVETGDSPASTFNLIVHRVAPEIAKAYLKSGGGVGERGADEKDFDPSLGPGILAANVQQTARMLRSKIASKEYQWQRNAAPWDDFTTHFINPQARQVLQTWDPQGGGAPGGQQQQAHPFDNPQFYKQQP